MNTNENSLLNHFSLLINVDANKFFKFDTFYGVKNSNHNTPRLYFNEKNKLNLGSNLILFHVIEKCSSMELMSSTDIDIGINVDNVVSFVKHYNNVYTNLNPYYILINDEYIWIVNRDVEYSYLVLSLSDPYITLDLWKYLIIKINDEI